MNHIVVVGAHGRIGSILSRRYKDVHNVTEFGRSQIDLQNPTSVRDALQSLDFDLLILTAAQTAVDYCEDREDEAFAVNASAPELIAGICARKGARMIHFGSDYVFDGQLGRPYTEADEAKPISVYGASKLAGELAVAGASERHLVARVSWVFGPGKPAFPEWIVRQALEREEVSLPADKVACPTHAGDLATWLEPLLFRDEASGILHLCNSQPCTWQEWGQYCLDVAVELDLPLKSRRVGGSSLDSVKAFAAARPANSAMDTAKYTSLTGDRPRPWREAVAEHLKSGGTGMAPGPK